MLIVEPLDGFVGVSEPPHADRETKPIAHANEFATRIGKPPSSTGCAVRRCKPNTIDFSPENRASPLGELLASKTVYAKARSIGGLNNSLDLVLKKMDVHSKPP